MKLSKFFLVTFVVLMMASGALIAQNLQVSIANLVNGSQIADCQNFIVQLNVTSEDTTIYDVRVYANYSQIARIRKEPWEAEWKKLVTGFYQIYAKITDDAKNVAYSDTLGIYVGDVQTSNLISNSYFNCNTQSWGFQRNEGAQADTLWEADADISEGGAIFIDVIDGKDTDWYLQLFQRFPIDSGHVYEISFIAETPTAKAIQWAMQENTGDFQHYGGATVTVEGNGFFGPYEFIAPRDDPQCAFKFFLGANNVPIYFDDVMVMDYEVEFPPVISDVEDKGEVLPQKYALLSSYPNPFNSTTVIKYTTPDAGDVDLKILNIRGEYVKTLVNTHRHAGEYTVQWDGKNEAGLSVTSGAYIAQLTTKTPVKTQIRTLKLMLVE